MLTKGELESVLSEDSVLVHDDMLILRGQKHTAGLEQDWWRAMPPTGEVTGYWNKWTGEHKGKDWVASPEDSPHWTACKERALNISKEVRLVGYDSALELRMRNLWHDFRTRYRLTLEALVKAEVNGVLSYRGRHSEGSRGRQEAIRNRLKANWKVAAYEHDVILLGEVAETLFREAKAYGEENGLTVYDDTIYWKGYQQAKTKDKPMLVKVYRLTKHGIPDAVKIEVTFRSDYLKRSGLREPNLWGTQPEIQERVKGALMKHWKAVLKHAPETRERLSGELGVTQPDLFAAIAENRNTLTNRVERLERRQQEILRRLEAVERDREREW